MSKIDWSKPLQTSMGKPARLICTDRESRDNKPYVVLITIPSGVEITEVCNKEGEGKRFKIVNASQKKYLILYDRKFPSVAMFETRDEAEKYLKMSSCSNDTIAEVIIP